MISKATATQCVQHIRRWQKKHRLRDYQVEELLRWMLKATGNKSFTDSTKMLFDTYKESEDETDVETQSEED